MLSAPRDSAHAISAAPRREIMPRVQRDVERLNDLARRQPEAVLGVLEYWLSKSERPARGIG